MIDFPDNPAPGDIHIENGLSWRWDGGKWVPIGPSELVSYPLQISLGGTGSTTPQNALYALGGAPLDSPMFLGNPRGPTPASDDNGSSLATTSFVKAQNYVSGGPYLALSGGTVTGLLVVNRNAQAAPAPLAGATAQFVGVSASAARLQLDGFAGQPTLALRYAGGTPDAPSPVVSGNVLGALAVHGYAPAGYTAARGWALWYADENWSDTAHGTRFELALVKVGTTATYAALTINGGGNAAFGNDLSVLGNLWSGPAQFYKAGGGNPVTLVTDNGIDNYLVQTITGKRQWLVGPQSTNDRFIIYDSTASRYGLTISGSNGSATLWNGLGVTGNITVTGDVAINSSSGGPLIVSRSGANGCNVYVNNGVRSWVIVNSGAGEFWLYDGTANTTRFKIDTAGLTTLYNGLSVTGNIAQTGNYHYFAGTATNVPIDGTGGPFLYADTNRVVVKLGSGSGGTSGFTVQDYNGVSRHLLKFDGTATFVSTASGLIDQNMLTLNTQANSDSFIRYNSGRLIGIGQKGDGRFMIYDYSSGGGTRLVIDTDGQVHFYREVKSQGGYAGFFLDNRNGAAGIGTFGVYADNGGLRFWNSTDGDILRLLGNTNAGYATNTGPMIRADGNNLVINARDNAGVHLAWDQAGGSILMGKYTYCYGDLQPDSNGNWSVGVGGRAWSNVCAYNYPSASGRDEKLDIAELDRDALGKVIALVPKQFRWREDWDSERGRRVEPDDRRHHGFIADEVLEVMGERFAGYNRSSSGHETIAYNELTAVLWQAVRELSAELDSVKAQLAEARR